MTSWWPLRRRKVPKAAVFTDQLRHLIAQGVPEVEAVEALLRDMPSSRLKEIVSLVSDRLKSGRSLSASLSGFPRYFPEGYLSIIEAGEKSEDLPWALELASAFVNTRDVSRQRIFLGVFLPLMTTVICFAAIRLFQNFIFPYLHEMVDGFSYHGLLPQPPRLLHLFDTALIVFACLIIPLLSFFFAIFYYPACKSVVLYRFCNLLRLVLEARLPLVECHRLTRRTSSGRSFRRAVDQLLKKLDSGESMGSAFATTPYFRGELCWMVTAGESKADIPGALADAADFYNVKADSKLSHLFNIAPPVVTIAIAIPIAILGASLFALLRWGLDVGLLGPP